MINFSLVCQSNHWPARIKKVNFMVNKILNYKTELKFKNDIYYDCNIILTNNFLVKKMNSQYRKKKSPTDVLTFVSELKIKKIKKQKICDIFLSAQIIKMDAKTNKISFYDHLTHLLVHSFLHINGFKHKKIQDFNKMKKIETMVLNKMGIPNPYVI